MFVVCIYSMISEAHQYFGLFLGPDTCYPVRKFNPIIMHGFDSGQTLPSSDSPWWAIPFMHQTNIIMGL